MADGRARRREYRYEPRASSGSRAATAALRWRTGRPGRSSGRTSQLQRAVHRQSLLFCLSGQHGMSGRHGRASHAALMRSPCCRWRSHGRQRQTGGHQDRESEIKQSPQIHGWIIPRDGELWKPATFTCSPVTAKSLGTVKLTKASKIMDGCHFRSTARREAASRAERNCCLSSVS